MSRSDPFLQKPIDTLNEHTMKSADQLYFDSYKLS